MGWEEKYCYWLMLVVRSKQGRYSVQWWCTVQEKFTCEIQGVTSAFWPFVSG